MNRLTTAAQPHVLSAALWLACAGPAVAQPEVSKDYTSKAQLIVDCDQALRDAWRSGRCAVAFRTPSQLEGEAPFFGEFKVEWHDLKCRFDGKTWNEGESSETADRFVFCSSGDRTAIWKPEQSSLSVYSEPSTHPANYFFTIGWPQRGWAQLGPDFNTSVVTGLLHPPPTVLRATVENSGDRLTFTAFAGEHGEGKRVFDLAFGGAAIECTMGDKRQRTEWAKLGDAFVPTRVLFHRGSTAPTTEGDYETVVSISDVDLKYVPPASRFTISDSEVPNGTLISTTRNLQSSVRTKGGTSVERTFDRLRNAADAARDSGFAEPEASR